MSAFARTAKLHIGMKKNMQLLSKIYLLRDPETNEARYVGATSRPLNKRLIGHVNDKSNTDKSKWISELKVNGNEPKIEIIEICNEEDKRAREFFWIAHFKRIGNIFNIVEARKPDKINIRIKKVYGGGMKPIEIKIALIRKGISQAEIAKRAGVSRQMVGLIINRKAVSAMVMRELANALGKTVDQVFPT